MKKFILSALTVISFTFASQAQFKIGAKAGAGFNNQRINVTEGSIYSSDRFKGYHAGLIGDLNLGKNFYLQPQLLYAKKGATFLSTDGQDHEIRMSYIETPVNLLYKFNLPFGKAFVGTGATFSYAVAGKQTQGGKSSNLFTAEKDWKREDLSLNFTTGFEFNNGLFTSVNVQRGLLNTSNIEGSSSKSQSLSLSVGYLIDWKKMKRKS